MELNEFVENLNNRVLRDGASSFFSQKENDALQWLVRQTHVRTNHAKMLVGPDEGAFLKLFVTESCRSLSSIRILELGTFTGYSLICLASAAKEIGRRSSVLALEINDELQYLIDAAVAKAGLRDFASVKFGDAKILMQSLSGSCGSTAGSDITDSAESSAEIFDIIFIDANKREYVDYYNLAMPLLKRGGYILADNVLWYGKIAAAESGSVKLDPQTKGIMEFDKLVRNETEKGAVGSALLDIRDGLYIIQKIR